MLIFTSFQLTSFWFCFFLCFICFPDSVNKSKSSRVHLVWCISGVSDHPFLTCVCVCVCACVCVCVVDCALSIAFYCWKGGMHHGRKCSKNIQPNFSKCRALCKNIIFFSERKKTGVVYFCAWPQGLPVSSESNSQLWTNYCHRWLMCSCQSKMTHAVLASLCITYCSCL